MNVEYRIRFERDGITIRPLEIEPKVTDSRHVQFRLCRTHGETRQLMLQRDGGLDANPIGRGNGLDDNPSGRGSGLDDNPSGRGSGLDDNPNGRGSGLDANPSGRGSGPTKTDRGN